LVSWLFTKQPRSHNGTISFTQIGRRTNINNKQSIFEVGFYDTEGWAMDLDVVGNFAYIADWDNGLRVIDISNRDNPIEIGSDDRNDYALGVDVESDYAYVAYGWDGLRIYDISDKEQPEEIGEYQTVGQAYDVFIDDNYAYLLVSEEFYIIDVRDKEHPILVGFLTLDDYGADVFVLGDYAYVADREEGLIIIDISNKYFPEEVGGYKIDGSANGVFIDDSTAYVAHGYQGVRVVDVTDKESPVEVGYYDTGCYSIGTYFVEDYIYVADSLDGFYLLGYELNTPPEVVDFSYSAPNVNRADAITLYANAIDYPDQQSELTCQMQYRSPSEAWTDIYDVNYASNHFKANFIPPKESEIGLYDIRVRFIDTEGAESDWYVIPQAISVLNNNPEVQDISFSKRVINRNDWIDISINGWDLENSESDLISEVQYKSPLGGWEALDDISFVSGYWNVRFVVGETAEVGMYDFRARFIDLDNGSSEWLVQYSQVEVKENKKVAFGDNFSLSRV